MLQQREMEFKVWPSDREYRIRMFVVIAIQIGLVFCCLYAGIFCREELRYPNALLYCIILPVGGAIGTYITYRRTQDGTAAEEET